MHLNTELRHSLGCPLVLHKSCDYLTNQLQATANPFNRESCFP